MGARLADNDTVDTHFLSVRCGLSAGTSAWASRAFSRKRLGPAFSAPPLWAQGVKPWPVATMWQRLFSLCPAGLFPSELVEVALYSSQEFV